MNRQNFGYYTMTTIKLYTKKDWNFFWILSKIISLGNESKPVEKVQNNCKNVVKTSIVPVQNVEESSKSFVQLPIKTIQRVNTDPQNLIQSSNNSRLNILTPQQVAQRANIVAINNTTKAKFWLAFDFLSPKFYLAL